MKFAISQQFWSVEIQAHGTEALRSVAPVTEFHPELRRARFFPRSTVSPATLPLMRWSMKFQERGGAAGVEALTLTSGVNMRLHRPPNVDAGTGPALLWIHGGGYVIGSPTQDDVICRRFAKSSGSRSPPSSIGWHPKTLIPLRSTTATRR